MKYYFPFTTIFVVVSSSLLLFANATDDESCKNLRIAVQTDWWPTENSWEIKDYETKRVVYRNGPFPQIFSIYENEGCIDPTACLTFHMLDSYGDGMLNGYYEVEYDGSIVVEGGSQRGGDAFAEEISNPFGHCQDFVSTPPSLLPLPLPTPSVELTLNPSISPTLQTSHTPSASPTKSLTHLPSASPTNVPSASPTLQPTDAPSVTPTISPTILPSAVPSSTPVKQCKDVTVNLFTDYWPNDISWEVRNVNSNTVLIQNEEPYTQLFTLFQQTICVPRNDCLEFTIFDAYGDGLSWGYYELLYDDEVLIDGGSLRGGGKYTSEGLDNFGSCTEDGDDDFTDSPTISNYPSLLPSAAPTSSPTITVSQSPSHSPTLSPSSSPTKTSFPSHSPTITRSKSPSGIPTPIPTFTPSSSPSGTPTKTLTQNPSNVPTISSSPTTSPTATASSNPSSSPTLKPTTSPFASPSTVPTVTSSNSPSFSPTSTHPTTSPFVSPSVPPTELESNVPSFKPSSSVPTKSPTNNPTKNPTKSPTRSPTKVPTNKPTKSPTKAPTTSPTQSPTKSPTKSPTESPTKAPTNKPTKSPTQSPTTEPSPFEITLFRVGSNSNYDQAFALAKARWEEIIRGDLTNQFANPNDSNFDWFGGEWNAQGIRNNDPIEDLLIGYEITEIDGRGGTLGFAGPTFARFDEPGKITTIAGIMKFDVRDFEIFSSTDAYLVILHEMGHVLGLGTYLQFQCGEECTNGNDSYTCLEASEEYTKIFPNKVLELDLQSCGHWSEGAFQTPSKSELMTPFFESGKYQPLSRVSVGALSDLGYVVDLTKADPWNRNRRPQGGGASAIQTPIAQSNFVLSEKNVHHPNMMNDDEYHRRKR